MLSLADPFVYEVYILYSDYGETPASKLSPKVGMEKGQWQAARPQKHLDELEEQHDGSDIPGTVEKSSLRTVLVKFIGLPVNA